MSRGRWALLIGLTVATILSLLLVFLWPSADTPTKQAVSATLQSSSVRKTVSRQPLKLLNTFHVLFAVIPIIAIIVVIVLLFVIIKRPLEQHETFDRSDENLHEQGPVWPKWLVGVGAVVLLFAFVLVIRIKSPHKSTSPTNSLEERPWYVEIPKDFDVEMELILKMDKRKIVADGFDVEFYSRLYTPGKWFCTLSFLLIEDWAQTLYNNASRKATCITNWADSFVHRSSHGLFDVDHGNPLVLAEYDLVFIPVFHKNNHSKMIVIDNRSREIVYYDSRAWHSDQVIKEISKHIWVSSNITCEYKTVFMSKPEQKNVDDCYIYTTAFAYFYILGYTHDNMPFSQDDIIYLRRLFAYRWYLVSLYNSLWDKKECYLNSGISKEQMMRLFNMFTAYDDQELVGNIVELLPLMDEERIKYLIEHVTRPEECLKLLRRNAQNAKIWR